MNNLASISNVQPERSEMPNVVPKVVKGLANEVNNSINNDFISHPQQYPLEIKPLRRWPSRSWPWSKQESPPRASGLATSSPTKSKRATVGLSVHSSEYFETGTQVRISIPLRGEAQSFAGTVVLVRELSEGFEIGLWLASDEDETRARIVEKICRAECDLGKKTLAADPRVHPHTQTATKRPWLELPGNKPLLGH